jgi:hypothetical protein
LKRSARHIGARLPERRQRAPGGSQPAQSIDASVSYKTIQEMTDAELLAIAAGGEDESRYASGEASNGQTTDGVEHIGIYQAY